MKFELILLCQLCGAKMEVLWIRLHVMRRILLVTKSVALSLQKTVIYQINLKIISFLTLLKCQLGWKCVGFMSATPHTIRKY